MPTATTRCSWAQAVIAASLLRDCATRCYWRAPPGSRPARMSVRQRLRTYGIAGEDQELGQVAPPGLFTDRSRRFALRSACTRTGTFKLKVLDPRVRSNPASTNTL